MILPEEREVTITFNDAEPRAKVYTASPVWMRKFDRAVEQSPDLFEFEHEDKMDGKVVAKFYNCDKSMIKLKTKKRVLSDEQKAAYAARFNKNKDESDEE